MKLPRQPASMYEAPPDKDLHYLVLVIIVFPKNALRVFLRLITELQKSARNLSY